MARHDPRFKPVEREELEDLGFGARVAQESGQRLLNRDGTFNVRREGLSVFRSRSLYLHFLDISWPAFHAIIAAGFLLFNTIFATAYLLCGEGALRGTTGTTPVERFADAFFFSVQTSTTIGYGQVAPVGLAANITVSLEVMVGLLGFALATGLVFARFSRPNARVAFSNLAVVAPYRGITAFEFRVANERSNQLIQAEVSVLFSRMELHEGKMVRRFHQLALERASVVFFPLHWTVVHPIDASSPLHGLSHEQFVASDPEIEILLTAIDETFSQTVHARSSYKAGEIVWGAKFADMYHRPARGVLSVDLRRLHVIEPAELP
jgi:inward rectifier potassium channel